MEAFLVGDVLECPEEMVLDGNYNDSDIKSE
jgi:hypothetical protein